MTKKSIKDLYKKMSDGDNLADDEVLSLMLYFKNLRDLLSMGGDKFHLAFLEANARFNTLHSWAKSRELIWSVESRSEMRYLI